MNILLVAPYKKSYYGLGKFPPIGLGYLATSLRRKGYKVKILDCLKEDMDSKGYRDYIVENRPNVVGVNSWSSSIKEVKEILKITKEIDNRITTIVGGPHPSAIPQETMEYFYYAEFGFKGEAEIGLPMLVDKLSKKKEIDVRQIPGLIWKENNRWNVNEQIFCEDLDALDYLAWDLIRPEEYSQPGTITFGKTAPIITTRGCPYICTFCSPHIIAGRKIRYRSTENIIHEIKLLKSRYGIKKIAIMDENFTLNKNHVLSLCHRIIKEKINMEFSLPNGIRLDTLNKELLMLMRKAGFTSSVAVGIESGSERILKMIKKHLKKETVKEKIDLMRRCGFRPIGYFILGFPTETIDEMYETLEFARELKLYRAGFSPLFILPGTEIYNELKCKGDLPFDYDFTTLFTDSISYAPRGLTLEEFGKVRKNIVLRFNLQPRVIFDYMCDLNSFIFALVKFRGIFLKRHSYIYAESKCNNN